VIIRQSIHGILALLGLALGTPVAQAQEVTGSVLSGAGRAPVPGAIVILAQPSGARLAATLTDDAGRYRLRAPSSGSFTLRVDVVGFRSISVPPFQVDTGATVTRDILFAFERTPLPVVAVTATSSCARVSGDAGDAPRLWSEARKTLEASRLAIDERRFTVALRRYERTIGPDSVLRASRTWTQTAVSQNPFESLAPEVIARDGFSIARDTGRYYYAPDAAILLSDAFVSAHCFGTRRGGPSGEIGLTFRPQSTGSRTEISGVLWLDSATAELRTLEYRYVPSVGRQNVGGGLVAFGRYPSGVWGVQRWIIRLPVLQVTESTRRPDGALGRFVDTMVVALREVGGEVIAAGTSAASSSRARLTGTVYDSTLGAALPGAMVTIEGLGLTTQTDRDGRFAFDSIADEGEVRLRVWHARLDSLALASPATPVRLRQRTDNTATLTMPGLAAVTRSRCSGASRNAERLIVGTLQTAAGSAQPVPAAEVVLLERRGVNAGGSDSLLRHVAITSDLGRYAFCDVAPGAQTWLLARSRTEWTDPRHVRGETAPPVEIVPLQTLPLSGDALVDSASGVMTETGAPAVVLGRTLSPGEPSRISGWALGPENSDARIQVLVDDVVRTTVSTDGSFTLGSVAAGLRKLTFRGDALAIRHIPVNVQDGQSQLLLVTFRTAPLVVVQRSSAAFDQRMADFRRRRRAGGGAFLERTEIEKRNSRTLTDLLRTIAGIRVQPKGSGYRYASSHFRRLGVGATETDDGTCDMMMYVDGLPFPVEGGDADTRIRVSEIAALEVYVSGGSVPRQFAGVSSACGVIVLWRG
jgi:hypothetical protein